VLSTVFSMLIALSPSVPAYTQPAEWEPQRAVWLSWPRYDHVADQSVAAVTAKLASAISKTAIVEILVSDPEMEVDANKLIRNAGGTGSKVKYTHINNNEIWTRDFGPIFLKHPDGRKKVASFAFNFWGYDEKGSALSEAEDQVDSYIGNLLGLPVVSSSLISEGGNREFNGKGTMMAVWAVEEQRNPGMPQSKVTEEFKRIFGVENVIWIPEGGAEDDLTFDGPLPGDVYTVVTTGGHVDNVARFVNPTTILLSEVTAEEARKDPIAAMSRKRFLAAEKVLRAARDQDGKPFKIVRMPSPDGLIRTLTPNDPTYQTISALEYKKGEFPVGKPVKAIAAGSYMNFLITNGSVITSSFYKPGRPESTKRKDALALKTLKSLFPSRKIITIDAEAVNWGGGGIHCITQQEPL